MGTAKLRGLENASGHRISVQGDLGILENLDERKTQWKRHQFYTELREKKKPLHRLDNGVNKNLQREKEELLLFIYLYPHVFHKEF